MLQPHAALSGPGLPAEGVAHVLDLPAVEERLGSSPPLCVTIESTSALKLAQEITVSCAWKGRWQSTALDAT